MFSSIGGYLGNNILLWGNIKKHDYFPLVALLGPDWMVMLVTYVFYIGLIVVNVNFSMYIFVSLN